MAHIVLHTPDGVTALTVSQILRRLRDEFAFVHADADRGQDHVAAMIAAIWRMSDTLPGKQEHLQWLQDKQSDAVYVSFGDEGSPDVAACCLIPEHELFFDDPEVIDGTARPLLDRAAEALDYQIRLG